MPTYQYACTECGDQLEVVQKFSDDALTECPACSGRLRKVFSAVGVVFKGSGFYRTDSRATGSSSTPAAAGASDSSSTSKPSDAGGGSSTAPAAAPSTPASKPASKPAPTTSS